MPMELRRTWPSDPGGIRVSSKCREYSDCRGLDDATDIIAGSAVRGA